MATVAAAVTKKPDEAAARGFSWDASEDLQIINSSLEFLTSVTRSSSVLPKKAITYIEEVVEEESSSASGKLEFRRYRLGFKQPNLILAAAAPLPPSGNRQIMNEFFKEKKLTEKELAKLYEKIDKIDVQYFKTYKKVKAAKEQSARIEAHIENILWMTGQYLVTTAVLYYVGPFAVGWYLNSLGSAAAPLANATTALAAATAEQATATAAVAAAQAAAEAPAIAAAAAEQLAAAAAGSGTSTGAGVTFQSITELLTSQRGEALNAAKTALTSANEAVAAATRVQKDVVDNISKSSGWKKLAFEFISEAFFGLSPYQTQELVTIMNTLQAQTLHLLQDPMFAKDYDKLFSVAFNGKNPLFGNVTGEDLKQTFKNEKGNPIVFPALKSYQQSVIGLTNFMIERALGPLVGSFFKLDPATLDLSSVDKVMKDMKEGAEAIGDGLSSTEKGILDYMTGSDTASKTLDAIKKIRNTKGLIVNGMKYYAKYKKQFDDIYALFQVPKPGAPKKVEEPFIKKILSKVTGSQVLRSRWKEYLLGGYDEAIKSLFAAAAAADPDGNAGKLLEGAIGGGAPAPTPTPAPAEGEAGPAPPPQEETVSLPPRPADAPEEETPQRGVLEMTGLFFTDLKDLVAEEGPKMIKGLPRNFVGYISTAMYDSGMNMLTAKIRDTIPGAFEQKPSVKTEYEIEEEKRKQEEYEKGIDILTKEYLKEGRKDDEILTLIRRARKELKPGAELDPNDYTMIEYTFKKLQTKSKELVKAGFEGNILFTWGSAILGSCLIEIGSAAERQEAVGETLSTSNPSLLHFKAFTYFGSGIIEAAVIYAQAVVKERLAGLSLKLQQDIQTLYTDVYDKYVKQPMMKWEWVQYVHKNVRRGWKQTVARAVKRFYLSVYITKVLGGLIDLLFDTLITLGTNLPMELTTHGQNSFSEWLTRNGYGSFNIFNITRTLQKYTMASGWDDMVDSINGKNIFRFLADVGDGMAENGFLGAQSRVQKYLTFNKDDVYGGMVTIGFKSGYRSARELIGLDTYQNEYIDSIVSQAEEFDEKIAEARTKTKEEEKKVREEYREFLKRVYSELEKKLEDVTTSEADKRVYRDQLPHIITHYFHNARRLSWLNSTIQLNEKTSWSDWFKQKAADVGEAQTDLGGIYVPNDVNDEMRELFPLGENRIQTYMRLQSIISNYYWDSITGLPGELAASILNRVERSVLDKVYSETSSVTGDRRYVDSIRIAVAPGIYIELTGKEKDRFYADYLRHDFIASTAESYIRDHNKEDLPDIMPDDFINEYASRTGFNLATVADIAGLKRDAQEWYKNLKDHLSSGSTLEDLRNFAMAERRKGMSEILKKYYPKKHQISNITLPPLVRLKSGQFARITPTASPDPNSQFESLFGYSIQVVDDKDLTPDEKKLDPLTYDSVEGLQKTIANTLLKDYFQDRLVFSRLKDGNHLLVVSNARGFFQKLFGPQVITSGELSAIELGNDGLDMLLAGNASEFKVDTNSDLYKRIKKEFDTNSRFRQNLIDYMNIPLVIAKLEKDMKNKMNSWDESRKASHEANIANYRNGKPLRLDADIADEYQALEDLEKKHKAAYDATVLSLPPDLQRQLQVNKKAMIQYYYDDLKNAHEEAANKLKELEQGKKIDCKSDGSSDKIKAIEEANDFIIGENDSSAILPVSTDILARLKKGCTPTKDYEELEKHLKQTQRDIEKLMKVLDKVFKRDNDYDLRPILNTITDIHSSLFKDNTKLAGLISNDTQTSNDLKNIDALLNAALEAHAKALGAKAKAANDEMKHLFSETPKNKNGKNIGKSYDKLKASFTAIPEELRGSTNPFTQLDELKVQLEGIHDSEYEKKEGETNAQYLERMKKLFEDTTSRGLTYDSNVSVINNVIISLQEGRDGFENALQYINGLSKINKPTFSTLIQGNRDVLFLTSPHVIEELERQEAELNRQIAAHNTIIEKLQEQAAQYKEKERKGPLTKEESLDFDEIKRSLRLLATEYKGLKEKLDKFNTTASEEFSKMKNNHKKEMGKRLQGFRDKLPSLANIQQDIYTVMSRIHELESLLLSSAEISHYVLSIQSELETLRAELTALEAFEQRVLQTGKDIDAALLKNTSGFIIIYSLPEGFDTASNEYSRNRANNLAKWESVRQNIIIFQDSIIKQLQGRARGLMDVNKRSQQERWRPVFDRLKAKYKFPPAATTPDEIKEIIYFAHSLSGSPDLSDLPITTDYFKVPRNASVDDVYENDIYISNLRRGIQYLEDGHVNIGEDGGSRYDAEFEYANRILQSGVNAPRIPRPPPRVSTPPKDQWEYFNRRIRNQNSDKQKGYRSQVTGLRAELEAAEAERERLRNLEIPSGDVAARKKRGEDIRGQNDIIRRVKEDLTKLKTTLEGAENIKTRNLQSRLDAIDSLMNSFSKATMNIDFEHVLMNTPRYAVFLDKFSNLQSLRNPEGLSSYTFEQYEQLIELLEGENIAQATADLNTLIEVDRREKEQSIIDSTNANREQLFSKIDSKIRNEEEILARLEEDLGLLQDTLLTDTDLRTQALILQGTRLVEQQRNRVIELKAMRILLEGDLPPNAKDYSSALALQAAIDSQKDTIASAVDVTYTNYETQLKELITRARKNSNDIYEELVAKNKATKQRIERVENLQKKWRITLSQSEADEVDLFYKNGNPTQKLLDLKEELRNAELLEEFLKTNKTKAGLTSFLQGIPEKDREIMLRILSEVGNDVTGNKPIDDTVERENLTKAVKEAIKKLDAQLEEKTKELEGETNEEKIKELNTLINTLQQQLAILNELAQKLESKTATTTKEENKLLRILALNIDEALRRSKDESPTEELGDIVLQLGRMAQNFLKNNFKKFHYQPNKGELHVYDFSFLPDEITREEFEKYMMREFILNDLLIADEASGSSKIQVTPPDDLLTAQKKYKDTLRNCLGDPLTITSKSLAAMKCSGVDPEHWKLVQETYAKALGNETEHLLVAKYLSYAIFDGYKETDKIKRNEALFLQNISDRFAYFLGEDVTQNPSWLTSATLLTIQRVGHLLRFLGARRGMNFGVSMRTIVYALRYGRNVPGLRELGTLAKGLTGVGLALSMTAGVYGLTKAFEYAGYDVSSWYAKTGLVVGGAVLGGGAFLAVLSYGFGISVSGLLTVVTGGTALLLFVAGTALVEGGAALMDYLVPDQESGETRDAKTERLRKIVEQGSKWRTSTVEMQKYLDLDPVSNIDQITNTKLKNKLKTNWKAVNSIVSERLLAAVKNPDMYKELEKAGIPTDWLDDIKRMATGTVIEANTWKKLEKQQISQVLKILFKNPLENPPSLQTISGGGKREEQEEIHKFIFIYYFFTCLQYFPLYGNGMTEEEVSAYIARRFTENISLLIINLLNHHNKNPSNTPDVCIFITIPFPIEPNTILELDTLYGSLTNNVALPIVVEDEEELVAATRESEARAARNAEIAARNAEAVSEKERAKLVEEQAARIIREISQTMTPRKALFITYQAKNIKLAATDFIKSTYNTITEGIEDPTQQYLSNLQRSTFVEADKSTKELNAVTSKIDSLLEEAATLERNSGKKIDGFESLIQSQQNFKSKKEHFLRSVIIPNSSIEAAIRQKITENTSGYFMFKTVNYENLNEDLMELIQEEYETILTRVYSLEGRNRKTQTNYTRRQQNIRKALQQGGKKGTRRKDRSHR